ncbi:MAG TPA: nuclear transport factor 2 family protein [Acidimicrobiales bacterium]|nr:nuclear transport factor 2 family protein [Acidimicrobiales bacterium]
MTASAPDELATLRRAVEELSGRLRAVEDLLAIQQAVARYGPAVDAGEADVVAELWTDDGRYDAGVGTWTGRDAIAGMVRGPQHQGFITGGAGHVVSNPHVAVDGDRAVALCHAQLLLRDEAADGFRVWRLTANRWDLARTPEGWRVTDRVNRQLDGDATARALFGDALAGPEEEPG